MTCKTLASIYRQIYCKRWGRVLRNVLAQPDGQKQSLSVHCRKHHQCLAKVLFAVASSITAMSRLQMSPL